MAIEFRCEYCKKLLRTSEDKAGLSARCPGCNADILVPELPGATDELELQLEAPGPSGRRKKCPLCGAPADGYSEQCRSCGEMLEFDGNEPVSSSPEGFLKPHRGVLLLVLSIVSWVFGCFLFSAAVWIIASKDLESMANGTMDPEGEGLTKAAKIVSIVNVAFTLLAVFACFTLMLVGFAVQP